MSLIIFSIMIVVWWWIHHKNTSITTHTSLHASAPSSIYQLVEDYEDQIHPDKTIEDNIRYNDLIRFLLDHCPTDTKRRGEERYQEMIDYTINIEKENELSEDVKLLLSYERFTKFIATRHLLKNFSDEEYCIQKYANLHYKKILQEFHIQYINDTLIIPKAPSDNDVSRAQEAKFNLLNYVKQRDISYINNAAYLLQEVPQIGVYSYDFFLQSLS
ncbi:MAG: hypothetical protein H6766_04110 [Candidatus Peribacteria bacterium]|nr:MAG: hypothetical protein H6766_04110 [Candidatus Peribacteria bacterium]